MATKHDEFKVYYFSFTDEELARITSALRVNGDDELADEIAEEIYGDDSDAEPESNIASLIFDIDCSAAGKATDELAKLKDAVDALADSYDVLNKAASLGVTTTDVALDATDRLIKESLNIASDERGHYLDLLDQFMKLKMEVD